MAVSSVISRVCDLTKPLIQEGLDHILVMGDDQGDQFDIAVSHGNEPQSLTGGSVTGYFIRIREGKKISEADTVIFTGSSTGNVASVILPEACYVEPGRFVLTIKANLNGRRHAIYVANGAIARSTTNTVVDPSHTIPDIDELLAYIGMIEQAVKDAKDVIIPAQNATNSANEAATRANAAALTANNTIIEALAAKDAANSAATSANEASTKANNAAKSANDAASAANSAATRVESAVTSASSAAASANSAASSANSAADSANSAASKANSAATSANEAATVAKKWGNVEVTVTILPEDGTAKCTVTDTSTGKQMAFDIPRGYTGLTPNLTIGTVETGLPGTQVEATLTGTKENPVLNLKIPRGETGAIESFPYATNTPKPDDILGSIGEADRVAREDHVHPISDKVVQTVNGVGPDEEGNVEVVAVNYATEMPLPPAQNGSIGKSDRVAREDHVHPMELNGRNFALDSFNNAHIVQASGNSKELYVCDISEYGQELIRKGQYKVCVSFEAKAISTNLNAAGIQIALRVNRLGLYIVRDYSNLTNQYERYSFISPTPPGPYGDEYPSIQVLFRTSTTLTDSVEYYIRNVKLELATVSTGWSLAPELEGKIEGLNIQEVVDAVLERYPAAEEARF